MCDLGLFIKDHMKLLMKVFAEELKDYGFQYSRNDTKCLNTAVTTMFSFLGKKSIHFTNFCDVNNVEERYKHSDKSIQTTKHFSKSILKETKYKRKLYYIMFTSGNLPHSDIYNKTIMFPGHVFVIDKSYDQHSKQNIYKLYQSYINQYNLDGAITKNNYQLTISKEKINNFVESILYFFENGIWDQRITKFWKELTFIDGSEFEKHIITDHIYFCYCAINVKSCTTTLINLLKEKQSSKDINEEDRKEINTLLEKLL